jgi:membrane-bound lytic murein transglycosylase D
LGFLKKILPAALAVLFLAFTASAAELRSIHPTDTLPETNDLKKGFKNLFVSTDIGDGISGERLNPQAIGFVQSYMKKNEKGLLKMKQWGKPYFDMIDEVLTQHGVPKQLKYLAVIESGLRVNVISWAGAVGPWALMPGTARMYGMKVTRNFDERTDYVKATHVAARLLKDLYKQYEDWLLVVAAYNGGPGNVNKAIRNSGSRDFWTLQHYLPNESQNHVKKFISTHYIMEGEGGVTTLTKAEVKDAKLNSNNSFLSKAEMDSSKTQSISGRYNAAIVSRHIEMNIDDFNRYNPDFDSKVGNNGKYDLRLPNVKMEIFLAKKFQILDESMQLLLRQTGSN